MALRIEFLTRSLDRGGRAQPGLHMNFQIEHRTGQKGGTSVWQDFPTGDGLFLARHFDTMSHGVFYQVLGLILALIFHLKELKKCMYVWDM